ncbi:MAG: hypothetical protein CMP67_10795 [Flavobacteriales bacterium]|nr:hypothetical protein [Flavobacteriales bacterium]|tara:strand:+ start:335 stop:730 length:396 start_codon:yes stop_codon:yes gene_type:complete
MNVKLLLLNFYFIFSLIFGILINTTFSNLVNISGLYLYSFFATIPLFILQFVSIAQFSRKIKKSNPKLFNQACLRPNGTKGSSINVASLFDDSIPFSKIKEESMIKDWNYTKRVIIYSMLSFAVLIILFFI